jgi:hypothetical protein
MKEEQALQKISKELEIDVTGKDSSGLRQALADKINQLINTDFSRLVSLLYRVDVNEQKLKIILKENANTDAGLLIADLMIERQSEKIRSRQQNQRGHNNISDEEKW